MVDYLARPVTHEAFFKKYASKRFLKGKHCHPLRTVLLLRDPSFDPNKKMGQEIRGRPWH